jgi:glycosyltransferase involved in cell wall biosynthesis
MPTYNGAEYINEAVNSVLNQSFGDFELIIVDDASRDNTLDILNKYKDPRIRLFRNKKRVGQIMNYNLSISHSRAKYIKPFHQDDILDKESLLLNTQIMDSKPEIGLVVSQACIVDSNSEKVSLRPVTFKPGIIEKRAILNKFFFNLNYNFIGEPSTVMLRKIALQEMGYFDERIPSSNDIELWSRINTKYKCYYIDKPLASIRYHSKQEMHKYRKSLKLAIWDHCRLFSALSKYNNLTVFYKSALLAEFIFRLPILVLGRSIKKILNIPDEKLIINNYLNPRE